MPWIAWSSKLKPQLTKYFLHNILKLFPLFSASFLMMPNAEQIAQQVILDCQVWLPVKLQCMQAGSLVRGLEWQLRVAG